MPIRILSSDLSSQISAGEVIERPASVVKEILENSIDAGSKSIDIIIEKSGFQSIIVKDNGIGINKKDLSLALVHHATSKIRQLSDLDTISTFGFRGEALASIRAVSRLTLISCTKFSNSAWKIYSEGFLNDLILLPIAHPIGTTIIIENLFYNIPVRLKFIENKQLEFSKILEVIKKIALSHFHISFSLKHNKKLVLLYNSLNNLNNKIKRLKDVLDVADIDQLLEIKSKKNDIFLFGWISHSQNFKKLKNIQYCYVNNRFVHNNLFIRAVCSASYEILGNKNISFILYINLPSCNIDINIHPTKNEIKFHQPNKIYIFIYETVLMFLKKLKKQFLPIDSFLKKNIYFKKLHVIERKKNTFFFNTDFKKNNFYISKLLVVTRKYYGLIYRHSSFLLISFPLAKGIVRKQKLTNYLNNKIIPPYFLTNIKFNITLKEYLILFKYKNILLKIGFHLIVKKNCFILTSIPNFLKKYNIELVIPDFFSFLFFEKEIFISQIVNWFYINFFIEKKNWTYIKGIKVLLEIERYCPVLFKNPPPQLLQKINIDAALCILKI